MADALRGNRIEVYENKRESDVDRRKYNVFVRNDLYVTLTEREWDPREAPGRLVLEYEGREDFSETEYPLRGEGIEIRDSSAANKRLPANKRQHINKGLPTYKLYLHPRLYNKFKENSDKWEETEHRPHTHAGSREPHTHTHSDTEPREPHTDDCEWVIAYYVTEEDFEVVEGDHRCK